MGKFNYGEEHLTCSLAMSIAHGKVEGVLTQKSIDRVNQSANYVEKIVNSEKTVYGINTGFGPLCTTKINFADTQKLQENILKSHAVGRGEPITEDLSKLMLILKVHALAQGYSGVQLKTIERLIFFINNNIIPVVPIQGSVGASGDLAPLSHLFLPLLGLGKVWYNHTIRITQDVYSELNLEPLNLEGKEGLALINGTQFMAAHGVKAVVELNRVLDNADLISTLMLEGLNGSIKPFFAELHALRPYNGNKYVASKIFNLLNGSEIVVSHMNCSRVQDPYSLRCIPQVHGASRNAWMHLRDTLEIEINSVTDNPILINEDLTISGGSFHGQPIALPLDYATLAASEIGNISDRRVYLALNGDTPNVPKLLIEKTGLNSGFMILQYTTAALASENKSLCFPASADSIPTSLGQEDHVSMGSISGRKLLQVIDNVDKILSIELICAAQALDFHRPLKSTPIIEGVHQIVRNVIPFIEEDQVMEEILDDALALIKSGLLLDKAKEISINNQVDYQNQELQSFLSF